MAETALTLIKAALRSIGAIATGETPTADEVQDGLLSMHLMLRNWSAQNIRLYYTDQESIAMTGAASYTIGDGGDIDTVRPASIRGAWTSDNPLTLISEARYRQVRMSGASSGLAGSLWYAPEYPLGVLYPWPYGGSTLYIDSLKPLTDPALITSDVSFPPEYDDAIRYNLAVRLATEYEKEPSQTVAALAISTLAAIEKRNFAEQIDEVQTELIHFTGPYTIDNC